MKVVVVEACAGDKQIAENELGMEYLYDIEPEYVVSGNQAGCRVIIVLRSGQFSAAGEDATSPLSNARDAGGLTSGAQPHFPACIL